MIIGNTIVITDLKIIIIMCMQMIGITGIVLIKIKKERINMLKIILW